MRKYSYIIKCLDTTSFLEEKKSCFYIVVLFLTVGMRSTMFVFADQHSFRPPCLILYHENREKKNKRHGLDNGFNVGK